MNLVPIIPPQNDNNFPETFKYFDSDKSWKALGFFGHNSVILKILAGGHFENALVPPAKVISRLPIIFKMFPMIYSISVPSFMLLS